MRIRVLELPTQSEGTEYRVPWILVIDQAGFHDLAKLEQLRPVVQEFGGEGVLVFKDPVELGEDR